MTLMELVDLVPDHSRIGIVEEIESGPLPKFRTLFSGYKQNFVRYCNKECIYPYGYEVTDVHGGSWENKFGLIIGVKLSDAKKCE